MRSKIQKQLRDATVKMEGKLAHVPPELTRQTELPTTGWSADRVKEELQKHGDMKHTRWEDGYVSGAVYHGGDDIIALQAEAFRKFSVSNPIHPDVFPGVRKMEAEVVAMVLAMYNAPNGAAGATTSGGTESILLACLSAREKARRERGVTEPEMYHLVSLILRGSHADITLGSSQIPLTLRSVRPAPTSRSRSISSPVRLPLTRSISQACPA